MNTPLPNGHWYALCTRSKCEKKVAHLLARKKFETYLPLRTITSNWSFLKKTEQEPLFPGIVFVRITEAQLAQVRSISGVCGVLHWLNAPALISDEDIAMIRCFLSEYSQVRVARTPVHPEPVCQEEEADYKVARMQNTVSRSLASLGFILVADMPAPRKAHDTPVPQIYPYYRFTDAG
ncbi:antitermination protein NusG [Flaviaesturariibacter flavus]|uniref:Antitermination protein NusG n=1 Tax=Flaviaesturariibacter flavus TaxID=2502780 RepID=A0A4R1BP24_9BACT|nr:transcription termination/antitermination NusG family protein [Flaviaesturariibacter flavus]TCJ19324.1 antitermination protein NusG [Flaviaesturariibacter flavus]